MTATCTTSGCSNQPEHGRRKCRACRNQQARERRAINRRRQRDTTTVGELLRPWIRQDEFRALVAAFIADQHQADLEGTGHQHAIDTLLDAASKDRDLALHRKIWSNPVLGQG